MSSETIVILLGTLLFFGFAAWMAFYSRNNEDDDAAQQNEAEKPRFPLSNKS